MDLLHSKVWGRRHADRSSVATTSAATWYDGYQEHPTPATSIMIWRESRQWMKVLSNSRVRQWLCRDLLSQCWCKDGVQAHADESKHTWMLRWRNRGHIQKLSRPTACGWWQSDWVALWSSWWGEQQIYYYGEQKVGRKRWEVPIVANVLRYA